VCSLATPLASGAQDAASAGAPAVQSREEVYEPLDRALAYLVREQLEDGSWGSAAPLELLELGYALESYYSWQQAAHALCCMALAAGPETPERRAALEKALTWLCESRLSGRRSDWDIDYVWTALYGLVACLELLDDARFADDARLVRRGRECLALLLKHQSDMGGWAYYDDPPFDRTPTWATSFCTALVIPYLQRAAARGWDVPPRVLERAVRYVRRCALPNGAYTYDLTPLPRIGGVEHINRVEGSLGRIQVCNWALVHAGVESVTPDVLRAGLEQFFEHHGFLDHVRGRPIPHEGYHANAGYFYFFGHYYAALVIGLLPEDEREAWHARLRPHLTKTQWRSGGLSDFLATPYLVNASTSFFVLSLQAGLPAEVRE
jgi:hypothetical protein